eukprot:34131-Pleurochrysis_carterae.AAC.1
MVVRMSRIDKAESNPHSRGPRRASREVETRSRRTSVQSPCPASTAARRSPQGLTGVAHARDKPTRRSRNHTRGRQRQAKYAHVRTQMHRLRKSQGVHPCSAQEHICIRTKIRERTRARALARESVHDAHYDKATHLQQTAHHANTRRASIERDT